MSHRAEREELINRDRRPGRARRRMEKIVAGYREEGGIKEQGLEARQRDVEEGGGVGGGNSEGLQDG